MQTNPYRIASNYEASRLAIELRAEHEAVQAEVAAEERYQEALQDGHRIDDAIGDVAFDTSRQEANRLALLLISNPEEYGRQLRTAVLLKLKEIAA